MNNSSTRKKIVIIWFYIVNVKEIGIFSREKIHEQELRTLQYLDYQENILIVLS